MRIGTVKQIWRYAVKSMAGEQLESCAVGMNGIPADRGWAVRDEKIGEITNGKHNPLLMQCAARVKCVSATWSRWLKLLRAEAGSSVPPPPPSPIYRRKARL